VRSTDTVSRQGGDEFVVLLSEVRKLHDAAVCAEKILARSASPSPSITTIYMSPRASASQPIPMTEPMPTP
jgi:GGDEF domain-containing protein